MYFYWTARACSVKSQAANICLPGRTEVSAANYSTLTAARNQPETKRKHTAVAVFQKTLLMDADV